jgi:hypothetical protein
MSSLGTEKSTGRLRRSLTGALLAIAATALLAVPAGAQAFTVSGTASPTTLQAGAHSNFNIHLSFSGGTPKDLTISLPPGEIGDPNAAPFCSVAQLNADNCPQNTTVGTASSMVSLLGVLPNPLPVSGNVYNLQPQAGEPARFGIALHALPLPAPLNTLILPPVIIQSGVQLRQTDFGLDTVVKNVPNSATLIQLGGTGIPVPISITSMDLGLLGTAPGTGRPFLRNPTSCAPLRAAFSAVPYSGSGASALAPPFTLSGCAGLPFAPRFSATLDVPRRQTAGEKPTLISAIDQANGEAGLRDAKVFIPPDMGADLSRLTPDQVCSQADFAAGSCPTVALLGSALATSPLLSSPLTGPVYLVDNPGGVAKIGLDLHGQLNMRIQGQLGIDNTTEFDGLPDIPISHFELRFDGGPNGILLTSRDICAPPAPVFHATFQGYNGASSSATAAATVNCAHPLGKCKKSKAKGKHRSFASESKKHHKRRSCKHRKKHHRK